MPNYFFSVAITVLTAFGTFGQTVHDTLIGVVNQELIKINKNTGNITNFQTITGIPAGMNHYKLTWCEPNQCFYTISQSFPPMLAKIDLSGNYTNLGALTYPSGTLFMCEGLGFNRFDGELYVSASLNGNPNSSPADYYSETLHRIDTNTLTTTLIGTFAAPISTISEADALAFDDNGLLYFYDGQPGQFNRFYMQDLSFTSPPTLLQYTTYTPTVNLTVKGNDLFFSQNRVLKKINIPTMTFSSVGTMFTSANFNGQMMQGLTWRVGCGTQSLFTSDTTICTGQSLILSPTVVGTSYLWQDGSTNSTIDASSGGTYSVEVMSGGCSYIDTIQVTVAQTPVLELGNDTTLCTGEILTLDASSIPGPYLWQDGSTNSSLTVSQNGIYWLTISNSCGSITDSVIVDYYPDITFDLGNDSTLCVGQTVTFDVTSVPGSSYLWQDGSTSPTFTVSTSGTYWVEISTNECTAIDSIDISFINEPDLDFGNDTTLCFGEILNLDASAFNGTYLWQNGSNAANYTVNQDGTYWLTVSNICGTTTDSIVVSYYPDYSFNLGNDTTICIGNTITLTCNVPNSIVIWQDGFVGSDYTASSDGIYFAQTSINGCEYADTIIISTIDVPIIDLGDDFIICVGENFQLSVEDQNSSIEWNTGSLESVIIVNSEGEYSVEVVNQCGTDFDTVYVQVEECFCGFYVPNAFTPDNDELNALFGPVSDCIISQFDFKIYNRWGEVIFESFDPNHFWDGTYLNKKVQDGVYTYKITYSSEYVIAETIVGHVSVIR